MKPALCITGAVALYAAAVVLGYLAFTLRNDGTGGAAAALTLAAAAHVMGAMALVEIALRGGRS